VAGAGRRTVCRQPASFNPLRTLYILHTALSENAAKPHHLRRSLSRKQRLHAKTHDFPDGTAVAPFFGNNPKRRER
jgi:hypothetical protein